ncbi:hypothetical protein VZC37_14235 [Gordonia sp. LSe1-13]|uniref:2-isopropylmalate synthase LeuA allosteric (dimerisation) domain-containing protein n=1 Tax=Gordonia sesuvii TaxID=3116777 RepID=A0ABU7MEG4_9ACTN|nr:hypothetical protein [Gordonia sp. LSe1-13]
MHTIQRHPSQRHPSPGTYEPSRCDPFHDRFGRPLPRGLREQATGLSWQDFLEEFAPRGAIRLGTWTSSPNHQDSVTCRATIGLADRIISLQATAAGPIGALTSMLYDLGAPVQIVGLHQYVVDDTVMTFLLCEHDDRQCWAYGTGPTADDANVDALIAGANRLLSSAGRVR